VKVVSHVKHEDRVIVFNDLPRMSNEHTYDTIDWFKNVFNCDVCIITGKNERYTDDFKLPVNYIDWEYEVEEEWIKHYNIVHLWKHWRTCQLLPKKYKYIIKARSDIHVDGVSTDYFRNLVDFGFKQGWTLGFGHLNTGKVFHNFARKRKGGPIPWMSDYVISHRRDAVTDPTKTVWPIFEDKPTWQEAKERCNAHRAWSIMFGDSHKTENILFPITRVEEIDNKQFGRLDDER